MLATLDEIERGLRDILDDGDIVWIRIDDEIHYNLTRDGVSPRELATAFDFLGRYAKEVQLQPDGDGTAIVVTELHEDVELTEESAFEGSLATVDRTVQNVQTME